MRALCFLCSSCSHKSEDYASTERTDRTLFLTRLANHLEHVREQMGDEDWQSFSDELHDRILPAADQGGRKKLDRGDLERVADGIQDQCRAWARHDKTLEGIVEQKDTESVTLALPKRWHEEQELLNQFHRLFRKLGDEEAASKTASECGTGYMKVGLFFCTDRKASGERTPSGLFGSQRARSMSTGIVRVSLPDYNNISSSGERLPYLWSHSPRRATGKTSSSPEVASCVVMDIEHHMRQAFGFSGGPKEVTVFIHGFNTDMAWSAKQMGIYAYKMRGEMPFLLYEWPSFQSLGEYGGDEANAMWSVPHLVTFLKGLLTSYDLEKVHLFSHSLGSHATLYALVRLAGWQAPRGAARLGQLLLVAPDFDTGEFYELQQDVSKQVERISIYCSKNDKPLNLSRKVHGGHHRLGHFNLEVHVAEGRHVGLEENVHVIDATGLDKSMAGHTYAFTHTGLMEDVCEVLRGKTKRPALRREEREGFRYSRYVGSSERIDSKTEDDVAAQSLDTSK